MNFLCWCKKGVIGGVVLTALFLLLSPVVFSQNLPESKEVPPTGYAEDSDQTDKRIFYHFNADLMYTYSDATNSDAMSGYSADVLFAPTFKLQKGTFLSFVYDGEYLKKREFYSDETGYRSRSEFMSHTISPVLRHDFGENDRYTVKPVMFFTNTYNKDTDNADWDDGLYNYQEWGVGVDFQIRDLYSTEEVADELTLGFQIYRRNYPNYNSLLDLATGLNTSADEKDYIGLILNTSYERSRDLGLSYSVGYSLFIKWLEDKRVVGTAGAMEGILTGDEQEDYLHMFETDMWYLFEQGLRIGLDLDAHFKNSNQNFYEGFNTVNLVDDIATDNYYDYFMYQISPNISYQFRLVPLTLFGSFTYSNMEYSHRLAENADETYKNEAQVDETYTTVVGARYAFNENWAVICQWEHVDTDSNNDNETTYQYDYWSDAFSVGVSMRF